MFEDESMFPWSEHQALEDDDDLSPPEVIWEPHPGSQTLFLSCPFHELLYHGTRGPGKTLALLMDYAQDIGQGYGATWRGVLFRESYPQLTDVISKSKQWFPRIFPGARYNEASHTWKFPEGEELLFRFFEREDDYWDYHGHEYAWIGWEELTNWATGQFYDLMMSTNRTSRPGVPKRVRATCNPWGAGHDWVKKYFIDPSNAQEGVPITTRMRHPITQEIMERTRAHIFGSVLENTHLMEADPAYFMNLVTQKDPNKRKAWLYGSWDINPAGFFGSVWDERKHWIKSFTPSPEWYCYPSFDWGSASPASLGLWAVSDGNEAPDGNIYPRGALLRFDELYVAESQNGETMNTGLRWTNQTLGKEIKKKVDYWEERGVKISKGVADPSIFKEDGGPSIYAQMRGGLVRDLFGRADNQRVAGWQKMYDMLDGKKDEGDDKGKPMMYIMDRCHSWRRTVPGVPRSQKNWDDIDTDTEDHIADESRYACMHERRELHVVKVAGV